jgi:membrane-bound ClpP family serine protease
MMRNVMELTAAIVLVLAGLLLLLKEFGVISADILRFWPAVLVIVGLVMLYEYFTGQKGPGDGLLG